MGTQEVEVRILELYSEYGIDLTKGSYEIVNNLMSMLESDLWDRIAPNIKYIYLSDFKGNKVKVDEIWWFKEEILALGAIGIDNIREHFTDRQVLIGRDGKPKIHIDKTIAKYIEDNYDIVDDIVIDMLNRNVPAIITPRAIDFYKSLLVYGRKLRHKLNMIGEESEGEFRDLYGDMYGDATNLLTCLCNQLDINDYLRIVSNDYLRMTRSELRETANKYYILEKDLIYRVKHDNKGLDEAIEIGKEEARKYNFGIHSKGNIETVYGITSSGMNMETIIKALIQRGEV